MKRLFLAIAILGLFVPVAEQAKAEVSINFFYDTLGSYGNWVEVPTYGYVWQPTVAASNTSWRPYADGYWAYTDQGWTWVSYEDFGWATYHYGRWARLRDRGWFWVPGYTWAPAWVSWRTGGDYIGWAPLPPDFSDEVVYEGRPVYGYVDAEYDIGPAYYNFVDIRYIGEPVLRERIFEPAQNITYMERTVNVTNITYNNNAVYTYGPDYNTVSAYSSRPVLRMALQRETVADPIAAAQNGALMQKQGDKLVVGAPFRLDKPATTLAPKVVKEKIANPVIEKGWSGIADPSKVAQLKQKIKAENPKQVPPPDIKPRPGASVAAASAPAASPATAASPFSASALPGTGASPATPASPASTAGAGAKGKGKNQRGPNGAPTPTMSAAGGTSVPPIPSRATNPPKGKGKHENARPNQLPPVARAPETDTAREAAPAGVAPQPQHGKGKGNKARELEMAPPVSAVPNIPPPYQASEVAPSSGGKHHGDANRAAREAAGGVPPQQPPRGPFSAEGQGPGRRPEMVPPQAAGAPPALAPQKGEKPKKGGPHDSPPPGQ